MMSLDLGKPVRSLLCFDLVLVWLKLLRKIGTSFLHELIYVFILVFVLVLLGFSYLCLRTSKILGWGELISA